jgi:hypothetical protein
VREDVAGREWIDKKREKRREGIIRLERRRQPKREHFPIVTVESKLHPAVIVPDSDAEHAHVPGMAINRQALPIKGVEEFI